MHILIIVVLSLVLSASVVMMNINYIKPSTIIELDLKNKIAKGFSDLESLWNIYLDDNHIRGWVCQQYESANGSYEHCEFKIVTPGYLPTSNWEAQLFPKYGFKPRAVQGYQWSYGETSDGWMFCLTGPTKESAINAMYRTQSNFQIDKIHINTSCSSISSITKEQSLMLNDISMTFWVKRK